MPKKRNKKAPYQATAEYDPLSPPDPGFVVTTAWAGSLNRNRGVLGRQPGQLEVEPDPTGTKPVGRLEAFSIRRTWMGHDVKMPIQVPTNGHARVHMIRALCPVHADRSGHAGNRQFIILKPDQSGLGQDMKFVLGLGTRIYGTHFYVTGLGKRGVGNEDNGTTR